MKESYQRCVVQPSLFLVSWGLLESLVLRRGIFSVVEADHCVGKHQYLPSFLPVSVG
jgi:hypothetical protein